MQLSCFHVWLPFPGGNWISGFLLALRIKSKLFPCMASMALSHLSSILRSDHTGLSAALTPRPCLASSIFPMLSPLLKSAFHPLSLAGSFSPAKFQLYMSLSKMASDHPIYQRKVPCCFSNSDLIFCIVLPATFMCYVSRAGTFFLKGQIVNYLLLSVTYPLFKKLKM